jgi:hypothetical protein
VLAEALPNLKERTEVAALWLVSFLDARWDWQARFDLSLCYGNAPLLPQKMRVAQKWD